MTKGKTLVEITIKKRLQKSGLSLSDFVKQLNGELTGKKLSSQRGELK